MERPQLFWFGQPPDEEQKLLIEQHKLHLEVHEEGSVPDFQFARAAIFWGTGKYFAEVHKYVKEFMEVAIDDGVFVAPVVSGSADLEVLNEVNDLLKSLDPKHAREAYYKVFSTPIDLHAVLHKFLLHDPGPPRNCNLGIEGEVTVQAEEDRRLLQRAFHKCSSIRLEPIAPGLSGADTFVVRATLIDSNAGLEPVPYFAKLGCSKKMQTEREAFRTFAEHHVEWYLRPNFVQERTIYGVARGILVGTYVQNSCSLADAVRKQDNGARHIKSLFTDTLSALRKQSRTVTEGTTSVVGALKAFCKYSRVSEATWQRASELFGGSCITAQHLWHRLIQLPPLDWQRSAIHGDLHGENVRVRKEDAILIDFAHAAPGPACADLAHLEVSLMFDAKPGDLEGEIWKGSVQELFAPEAIIASLASSAAMPRDDWMQAVVAEIRSLVPYASANPQSPEEYMRVLAVYLLRHASFPVNEADRAEDEYRRSFAYWLACRLTQHIEAMATAQAVPA